MRRSTTGRGLLPATALGLLAAALPARADCTETAVFDLPEINLAIFGLQFTADYLGPPEGTITETRAGLTYVSGGSLDAADIIIEFQAPSDGVPTWTLTGAELGWSGSGTFNASVSTDELNGVIDLGDPPPDFSLFFLRLTAADSQPLAGHFEGSSFEVDVAPPGFAAGDADGDGVVGVTDLSAIIVAWGPCPDEPEPCPADVTCDGVVDVEDLLEVILNWS